MWLIVCARVFFVCMCVLMHVCMRAWHVMRMPKKNELHAFGWSCVYVYVCTYTCSHTHNCFPGAGLRTWCPGTLTQSMYWACACSHKHTRKIMLDFSFSPLSPESKLSKILLHPTCFLLRVFQRCRVRFLQTYIASHTGLSVHSHHTMHKQTYTHHISLHRDWQESVHIFLTDDVHAKRRLLARIAPCETNACKIIGAEMDWGHYRVFDSGRAHTKRETTHTHKKKKENSSCGNSSCINSSLFAHAAGRYLCKMYACICMYMYIM